MDIEENIKILENLKKYLNLLIYEGTHKIIYNDLGWDEKTIDCINAIDHILAEREEDKKRIEELERKNRIYALEGSKIVLELHIKDNYIPKQKVLEEIDQVLEAFRKVEFNRVTTWNSLVLLKERLLGE